MPTSTLIARPRICDMLADGDARVSLIGAPSGYGKSSALRQFAQTTGAIYLALPRATTFARFANQFVDALSALAPGLRRTFTGAYGRALVAKDPPATLAGWVLRHLVGLSWTIIIDDLHHANEASVAQFLVEAIEHSPTDCKWLVASEALDDLPVSSWLRRGITNYPFHPFKLCLDAQEAAEFSRHFAPNHDEEAVRSMLEITSGVPADFVFALRLPERLLPKSATFDPYDAADVLYRELSGADRDLVAKTFLLPSLEATSLRKLLSNGELTRLTALNESAPYVFEPCGLRYHSCFDRFLRSQVGSLSGRDAVVARAAAVLEAAGEIPTALGMLAEIGSENRILAIVDRHGFEALENDRAMIFQDAVARLSAETRDKSAVALTLAAVTAAATDRPDLSESFFKKALSVSRHETERCSIRLWYASDLLRRRRSDAIDLLRRADDCAGVSAFVRIASESALAAGYALSGRDDLASTRIEHVLHDLRGVDDAALRARVLHQASYVALRGGRYDEAKVLAKESLALADRIAAAEIAASALSVLHNVAYSIDEDLGEAIGYLHRIAECGAASSSVERQLYALGNAYEIEVERGNERAAAAIEEQLLVFDVRYGMKASDEAILPAQVLQLTWRGEFARASQILKGSGGQQSDAGRRALRWSEIALYAAAAGTTSDASAAAERCRKELKTAPASDGHRWRASAYLALTLLLIGRKDSARKTIAEVAESASEAPGRVRALIKFVSLLTSEIRAPQAVFDALESLHELGSGGYARMIEALPKDLIDTSPQRRARKKAA